MTRKLQTPVKFDGHSVNALNSCTGQAVEGRGAVRGLRLDRATVTVDLVIFTPLVFSDFSTRRSRRHIVMDLEEAVVCIAPRMRQ